jgi:hypothetical protein
MQQDRAEQPGQAIDGAFRARVEEFMAKGGRPVRILEHLPELPGKAELGRLLQLLEEHPVSICRVRNERGGEGLSVRWPHGWSNEAAFGEICRLFWFSTGGDLYLELFENVMPVVGSKQ